jgi:hypothetical protein
MRCPAGQALGNEPGSLYDADELVEEVTLTFVIDLFFSDVKVVGKLTDVENDANRISVK